MESKSEVAELHALSTLRSTTEAESKALKEEILGLHEVIDTLKHRNQDLVGRVLACSL